MDSDFAGYYHDGMDVGYIHLSILSFMHSFNGQWLCRVLPWIHSFIHSITHSFVQWTVALQGVTMMEWLLYSFIHSIIHSFVQWTVTYVAGSYHDGMVVGFIHPFNHSCIRSMDSDYAGSVSYTHLTLPTTTYV